MGFENRKSIRVKLGVSLYFWPGEAALGSGHWGSCDNVSATGLAFHSATPASPGDPLLIEITLPDQNRPVHVTASVVSAQPGQDGQFHYRVSFSNLDSDDRHLIRLYVLQVAEPGMGWGRANFSGRQGIDVKYRELAASDREQWLAARSYLSIKELGYVKKFQLALDMAFGSKSPDNFKLLGSRPLKEQADAWLEFDMGYGQLHFLAKCLWCRHEKGERAECGLSLTAFHKDEAMKLEKTG